MKIRTIRSATQIDILSVADIHVAAFQDAYQGVVPNSFLEGLNKENSKKMWDGTLTKFPPNISVAEMNDGSVAGFCCAGPVVDVQKNEGYKFEIYALHVHPDSRRCGIGAALLRSAFKRAKEKLQVNTAIVWTLVDLPLSCKFYQREGGTAVKNGVWQLGNEHIQEIAYGWDDLAAIGPW